MNARAPSFDDTINDNTKELKKHYQTFEVQCSHLQLTTFLFMFDDEIITKIISSAIIER